VTCSWDHPLRKKDLSRECVHDSGRRGDGQHAFEN
jgi:hypothetical protein